MRKRRVGSGKGGGEQRRRSARISALEAAAAKKEKSAIGGSHSVYGQGSTSTSSASKTTGRISGKIARKRKRLEQDVESPSQTQEGEKTKQDRRVNLSSLQHLPEKRTLEFVIDILQRKDTNEIFSEPVDPEEVEGYYKVIKEPMDFGTMRAKLQEGMYTTMEQFERDAFLISSNAMQFNSSSTIYYREARVIHELAQKVFHALKTDPKSFQLEFSLTRRRSGRKSQSETRSQRPKVAKRGASPNGGMCSLNGPSLRKNTQAGLASSSSNLYVGRGDYDIYSDSRCGMNSSFFETERNQTYRPHNSFLSETESLVSAIYNAPKILLLNNHAGIGYEESLMRFVKDLGPTAQMVANRKLRKYTVEAPSFPFQSPSLIPTARFSKETAHPDVQLFRTLLGNLPGSHNVNKYANKPLDVRGDDANEKRTIHTTNGNRGIHIWEERAHANDKKDIKNGLLGGITANTRESKGKMICTNVDKIDHFQGAARDSQIQLGPCLRVSQIEDLNSPAGITNTSKYMTRVMMSESNQMGNLVPPSQSTTNSQSSLSEILSQSNLPLQNAKTPDLNQATTTLQSLQGFGSYSGHRLNLVSLNSKHEASSSQTAQIFGWNRPTPWSMGSSTNPGFSKSVSAALPHLCISNQPISSTFEATLFP